MAIGPMTTIEVLAVLRLRQWQQDRTALHNAKTTSYKRTGWRQRRETEFDARIVRAMDFERSMSQLTEPEQAVLLLSRRRQPQRHHERQHDRYQRKVSYLLPTARKHLAEVLDRLDLL